MEKEAEEVEETEEQASFQLVNRIRSPIMTYDWAFMQEVANVVGPLAVAVHCAITYLVYQGEDPSAQAIAHLLGCSVPTVKRQLVRLSQVEALAAKG